MQGQRQGTRTWPDSAKYLGEFKDGKYHEFGTYTRSNGIMYVGQYIVGKPHGHGIEYDADGSILRSGTWENGVFVRGGKWHVKRLIELISPSGRVANIHARPPYIRVPESTSRKIKVHFIENQGQITYIRDRGA